MGRALDTELPEVTPPEPEEPTYAPAAEPEVPPWSILVGPREGPENFFEPPATMRLDESYEFLRSAEGISDDPYASDLLWTGFYDPDATSEMRRSARAQYFDYMGYDQRGDFFDWNDWRDWYNEYYGVAR